MYTIMSNAGTRCAELGCGPGLVGVCLQRLGVGSILLTDGDAETLLNCRHNLSINSMLTGDIASPPTTTVMFVARPLSFEVKWSERGSDILYSV